MVIGLDTYSQPITIFTSIGRFLVELEEVIVSKSVTS